MSEPVVKYLLEGKHTAIISEIYHGFEIIKGRKTEYIEAKFENENGSILQKFHFNEAGRDLHIEPLFRRFGLKCDFFNSENVISGFKYLKGRTLSITVYIQDNGSKGVMGYKPEWT